MSGVPPPSYSGPSNSSSSSPSSSGMRHGTAPKILLAKPPGLGAAASRFSREDESSAAVRPRAPPLGSLNLVVSDSWELNADRALPFLTENTDFIVVGVIGPPGAGKSTIMNELYGYDGASAGMLPPFSVQSYETRSMARHCTIGIEIRVSSERMILLDAQPTFSPSLLSEMTRPDGSSSIPVTTGENSILSVDLAHEIMGLQLAIFLASVCHVLLVVTDGIHDTSMWQLMLAVDMLKHNIPDPSLISSEHVQAIKYSKEWRYDLPAPGDEFLAIPMFVHTKLQKQDLSPRNEMQMKNMLHEYFQSSSFSQNSAAEFGPNLSSREKILQAPDLILLPSKAQQDDGPQLKSFASTLEKLRNQVLSMNTLSFSKPISEREWLRNSAKIWEMVKRSLVIADYCKILQNSGQFRK